MNARQQKARELADRSHIEFVDGCYCVPSQSSGGRYTVLLEDADAACDCADFDLRGKPCKHILAARIWAERQRVGAGQGTVNALPAPKAKRKTYKQDWPNYNAAQTNEREHLHSLLSDLCEGVVEPPHAGRGRKPVPLADQAFAAVLKVYTLFSARRFMGELADAVREGLVRGMHFNTVLKAIENPALTPILVEMIRQSSLPLASVETTFAPDSSGFCTSRFTRWFDVKYGVTREEAEWVKVHLMCGVKTNIVTAVEILDKNAADSPLLPQLVEDTAEGFTVKEVCADKAYGSAENYDAVAALGATLYAPFKSNATGAVGGIFQKMFHFFSFKREEFLRHYHQRSNVESTFSMIKRKFGDSVRSKGDTAMKNEVLCKIVCHNICCLISAWYELGIEPILGTATNGSEREVIPMPRRSK
jgi:Transposase DDE domain/SWIM zinc finger